MNDLRPPGHEAKRMEGLSVPAETHECQIDQCSDLAIGLFEWATPRTTLYLCRRHAEVLGAIERLGVPAPVGHPPPETLG